jgi:alkylation response protein AidB-like acyl-CoA dehydrogenase
MSGKAMQAIAFDVRPGGSFLLDPVGHKRIFTRELLTPEQQAMAETARRFADEEVMPQIAAIEAGEPGVMRRLLGRAGELGLLMLDIPEAYGGLEQDKTTGMLLMEMLTRCASFAVAFATHVGIGSLPLVYFGTPEQKQRYLPRLATGEWIAAYALTEAGSGSDALAARTRADLTQDGRAYRLNGSKQFISNAGFADLFVVFAKVAGEHFSAFLVERNTPGFTVGREEKKHGILGSSTCPLSFEDAVVPATHLLGQVGQGHRIAFNTLNVARAKLGMGTLGASKYALELATRYAAQRKQFGQSIDQFGLIRAKLGEMACRIYAGESLGYRAVGLIDRKYEALQGLSPGNHDDDIEKGVAEYSIEASILKVVGSETLDWVIDEAVQIHGGYGFIAEYDVERIRRDARINRIFDGTNEVNRLWLAGTLIRRGMTHRLPLAQATEELLRELIAGRPPSFEPPGERLVAEAQAVERMKAGVLFASYHAVQRYQKAIEREQPVLAALADMLCDVFAADSAIARTLQRDPDDQRHAWCADCATLFVEQAHARVFSNGRSILCAALTGEKLEQALEQLGSLEMRRPIDLFAVRERVAAGVVARGGWPL